MAVKICTILKEALAIPGRNPKLIAPLFLVTFLVTFLFSYAIQISTHSLAAALATALATRTPAASIEPFIVMELVLVIVYIAVAPVLTALDIYALAMTHAGNQLTLRELLRDAKPVIRRSVATQLLIIFPVTFVYLLAMAPLVVLWQHVAGGQILLRGLIVVVAVAAGALFLWLTTLWGVTGTVTVVEESWGVAAVKRAAEVVRGGMWTAVAITVATNGADILAAVAQHVILNIIGGGMGVWGDVGVQAVYKLATQAVLFVTWGAFAAFYYEVERSRGGGAQGMTMVAGKGGFYGKLPTADVV